VSRTEDSAFLCKQAVLVKNTPTCLIMCKQANLSQPSWAKPGAPGPRPPHSQGARRARLASAWRRADRPGGGRRAAATGTPRCCARPPAPAAGCRGASCANCRGPRPHLGQQAAGGHVQQVRGGRVREHPRLQRPRLQVHGGVSVESHMLTVSALCRLRPGPTLTLSLAQARLQVHARAAAAGAARPRRAADVAADRERARLGAEPDQEGAARALCQLRLRQAARHGEAGHPGRAGRLPGARALRRAAPAP